LRNCGKLAARCSALRYVTRREKRRGKRIVCRRRDGGTARINDKRVRESLTNVLISGERWGGRGRVAVEDAGRERFLFDGQPRGGTEDKGRDKVQSRCRIFRTSLSLSLSLSCFSFGNFRSSTRVCECLRRRPLRI